MTVATLSLLRINEDQPAALGDYLSIVSPILEQAGARIVKRFRITEMVVGYRPALTAVIVEYPDLAAVDMVLKSREYQSARPARNRAFLKVSVSIGLGDEQLLAATELLG